MRYTGIVAWLQQVERAAVVEGRHLGVALGHPGVEAGEQVEASGGEEDDVDAVAGDVVFQLRRRQIATGDAHRRCIHELGGTSRLASAATYWSSERITSLGALTPCNAIAIRSSA